MAAALAPRILTNSTAQTQTAVPPIPPQLGPQGDPTAPATPTLMAPHVGPMAPTTAYVPGAPGTYSGTAPTATPYGAFSAPDPNAMPSDPYYQFRLSEGLKAQQHGAAARGTLLSGGFQKALTGYAQGLASEEGDKIYGRAMNTYTTNRDTNQQNFGQSLASYGAGRDTFNANTAATLGADRLGLEASQAAYGQARDAYGDRMGQAATDANATNVNAQNAHEDQLAEYARLAALQRQRSLAPSLGRMH